MLQYCRRNTANVLTVNLLKESAIPLLTYCNWSYTLDYYIFNETPSQFLKAFYQILLQDGFKVKVLF